MRNCYVYIITNFKNTVFYIGVTRNLQRRISEHKSGTIKGFSERYKLKKLIYFEQYPNIIDAIKREKQLKNWHRSWKINLVKSMNPRFIDLDPEINSG